MPKPQPDDPQVLQAVLQRIRTMSREEVLDRARRHSGFDEAWVSKAANRKHGSATPTRRGRRKGGSAGR
jgi:hypothetical protein